MRATDQSNANGAGEARELVGEPIDAPQTAFEHPFVVRLCHWVNSVALLVMAGSGLQIFRAFPSFGPKIPQNNLLIVPKALTLGGWLGGALQWHITFAWIYLASGLTYVGYQMFSGNYRQLTLTQTDFRGIWPMIRHYFFFGKKPSATGTYNPLQKFAYLFVLLLGVGSALTGMVLYNPVQFSALAWIAGGFHHARFWHFLILCGMGSFLIGHLVMVILHGWNNFASMLTGWKRNPEHVP